MNDSRSMSNRKAHPERNHSPFSLFVYVKILLAFGVFFTGNLFAQTNSSATTKYLFFLHNRFVQLYDLDVPHPEYGKAEYSEIVAKFRENGFTVFSEKRPANTNAKVYANKIVSQIDSLLNKGVKPENITVVGTSLGGYIAQYVCTDLKNPKINFVFVGCFLEQDLVEMPEIQLCGNILSIYEKSDTLGGSALKRKETSKLSIPHFKEIELHTNMKHGFLYHPMEEWMQPSMQWARQNFGVLTKKEIQSGVTSILQSNPGNPFHGILLIKENDNLVFAKMQGYADRENNIPISANSQFVIGSISKQFTAVLVLLEMEKGSLTLEDKIGKHLPDLKRSWKDSITIYHLLTHTHGIVSMNDALLFIPGTKMDYENGNNTGYKLLSEILEKTSGKNFATLSEELFTRCGMKNTFHPDNKKYRYLVKGYTQHEGQEIKIETQSFQSSPAAGCFISTAADLIRWNECLHQGKILKPETYKRMTTIQDHVIRQHPLWGATEYGLGLTVRNKENLLQLGQTGFAPGFVSMNFYFPETKTSVVLLQNISYSGTLPQKFFYHGQVIEFLRDKLKCGKFLAEKNVFGQGNRSLPYRLIYPDRQELTKKYPLLVYLHGMGNRGTDNERPLLRFSPFIIDTLNSKNKFPCYILVPQCPANDVWVKFPDFPNSLSVTHEPTPSASLVLALIHQLIETKNIDTGRIYLTGFSMGGEGTFDLLSREPGLFACGVPLASVADTSKAGVIKNIPIWAFHGNADDVNDVKYTRLEIDALKRYGGAPKYTELDDVPHDCRKETYHNSELWQWIFEQKKH